MKTTIQHTKQLRACFMITGLIMCLFVTNSAFASKLHTERNSLNQTISASYERMLNREQHSRKFSAINKQVSRKLIYIQNKIVSEFDRTLNLDLTKLLSKELQMIAYDKNQIASIECLICASSD